MARRRLPLRGGQTTDDVDFRLYRVEILGFHSDAQGTRLRWPSRDSVIYQVQRTVDLKGPWTNAPSGVAGDEQSRQQATGDSFMDYTDPSVKTDPAMFYRLKRD